MIGHPGGVFSARFAPQWVAFNQDRRHAEAAAEFNIRERVADHHAGCSGDLRELCDSLLEETGQGLTAVALSFVVRTDEECIDVRAGGGELALEGRVDGFDFRSGVETARDATLVGDHDGEKPGLIDAAQCLRHAGEHMEVVPASDVLTFLHFLVQNSIAIEEDGSQTARN